MHRHPQKHDAVEGGRPTILNPWAMASLCTAARLRSVCALLLVLLPLVVVAPPPSADSMTRDLTLLLLLLPLLLGVWVPRWETGVPMGVPAGVPTLDCPGMPSGSPRLRSAKMASHPS